MALRTFLDTIREQQDAYVALRTQGLGKREAARRSGYPYRSAIKDKAIETPELRRRIQAGLLQDHGIAEMANVLREGMRATLPQTDKETGKLSSSDIADHRSRTQAVRVAADLMGMTERQAGNVNAIAVNITIPAGLASSFAHCVQTDDVADVPRGTIAPPAPEPE